MSEAYRALEERFARLADLQGAIAVLTWDQAVWMPKGGAAARGGQLATLRRLAHELLTAPETRPLLEDALVLADDLGDWQRANLREMRRLWSEATAIDPALIERAAHATTRAELVWREARAERLCHAGATSRGSGGTRARARGSARHCPRPCPL